MFSLQLTSCHRVRRHFPYRLGGSDVLPMEHLLLSNLLCFVASMFQVLLGVKKTFSNMNISCHFAGLVRATTTICTDFRKLNLLQIDSNVNSTNDLRKVIYTLQGINISHLGKRKIIFKMPFLGGYVSSLEGSS